MTTDRESLLEAVNHLVEMEDASGLFSDLQALIPVARNLGARFSGARAVVNPLLDLALSNPEQFARVVELIGSKREAAGRSPLTGAVDDTFDKADYMREFMQQKRDRERRAVKIENMIRPENAQLKGRARLDFMQVQSARWNHQRTELLEKARAANSGRLSREVQNELLRGFWQRIDDELDGLEQLARAEQLGVKRK